MVRDPVAEGADRAVIAAAVELRTAVGFVRHPRRALEGRPLVPGAGVEEIEDAAHEILPAVVVESGGVAAAEHLEPVRGLCGEILIHGGGDGREEEGLRRGVVVDEDLRMPAQDPVHHDAHFRLTLRHEIAVHVEAEMVVPSRHAPRLVLLQRRGLSAPTATELYQAAKRSWPSGLADGLSTNTTFLRMRCVIESSPASIW